MYDTIFCVQYDDQIMNCPLYTFIYINKLWGIVVMHAVQW